MPTRPAVAPILVQQAEAPGKTVVIGEIYVVNRPQQPSRPATILETRIGKRGVSEAYISYLGEDKRLDTWVIYDQIGEKQEISPVAGPSHASLLAASKPSLTVEVQAGTGIPQPIPSAPSSPEREHATVTRVRNFEDVRFGEYLIKTWYYSPYPSIDERADERAASPVPTLARSSSSKRRKLNGSGSGSGDGTEILAVQPEVVQSGKGHSTMRANGHEKHGSRAKLGMPSSNGVVVKPVETTRGRIWVCDLCFKYMRNRASWDHHSSSCSMLLPPGRRVYQKGSYTLWEIDGAKEPLYCQNLSLFGKMFIDHKSVFFHVENFLFYVLCDAATSRRDQVMAFFSKEKVSYDDYNLACIITFPPFQNRGFGKLLIEFSYYLTQHPATRSHPNSPGTPERPLSDLGLKGYTAYWISVILRFCRQALADAPPHAPPSIIAASPSKPRARRSIVIVRRNVSTTVTINDVEATKTLSGSTAQYSISLSLCDLAKTCHLRTDDVASTLSQLGFLRHRRPLPTPVAPKPNPELALDGEDQEDGEDAKPALGDLDEWTNTEIVICREAVEREWTKWKVRPIGVLDESCVLL